MAFWHVVLIAVGSISLVGCGNPASDLPAARVATGAATEGGTVNKPAGQSSTEPLPFKPSAPRPSASDNGLIADGSRSGSPVPDTRAQAGASSADSLQSTEQANSDLIQREAQQRFAEMGEHPDATVRLQALDLVAQQPRDALDPVAYALLDDDDAQVRDRAQALWEQQPMQAEQDNGQVEW